MDAPSDGELMQTLGTSTDNSEKAQALDRLRQRYGPDMLACAEAELRGRIVNGLEGLDVVHEIFAELLLTAKAEKFDHARPLHPWLMTVVRNKARDLLRSEQRRIDANERLPRPQAGAPPDQSNLQLQVEELLCQLTDDERSLCVRFYMEDSSAADLAREFQTDAGHIYRDLHRLRIKLRSFKPPL
jgi:RNA polymerase sigma factor (sigma-70 family)